MRGKTLAALAFSLILSAVSALAAEVFPEHPRLLFRDRAWGPQAITTDVLLARAKDPRYAPFLARMDRRGSQNLALRSLLTGSREDARAAIKELLARGDYGETTDAGLELMWDAMTFDWLYHNPEFSEADRQKAIAILERGAEHCRDLYVNQGAHVFHTRMYAYPAGAAIAGLALAGHSPKAESFIEWGYEKYVTDLFPARQVQDGTVHNSLAYGRKYTMWLVGQFIACWYSATGENLWQTIRTQQEDWAWREALFCIYAEQPDGRMVRYGDNFFRGTERFSFRVIAERAHYYDEPVGRDYINKLLARHAAGTEGRIGTEMGNEYEVLLYWEPDSRSTDYTRLPVRRLFSPRGTGMAIWRTGWQADATFIFFKCGDYFDNHGHFDAGHVEVFRRAPLLIEGGSYAGGTESEHYKKYFHQSVAHNTIQILDSTDPQDDGSQRFYNNQGQGTIASYRANPLNEYGDVTDYREGQDWAYLASDFTAAYPTGRAKKVLRELVWAGNRWLVVIDNVSLADEKYSPRILWHYTVTPTIDGNSFTVSNGGARAAVALLAPAEARYDTVTAFRVDGGVYPPEKPSPDLGVGRVELGAPKAGATDYRFVEVIDIADDGTPVAAARLSRGETGGLTIDLGVGKVFLNGASGRRTEVIYKME